MLRRFREGWRSKRGSRTSHDQVPCRWIGTRRPLANRPSTSTAKDAALPSKPPGWRPRASRSVCMLGHWPQVLRRRRRQPKSSTSGRGAAGLPHAHSRPRGPLGNFTARRKQTPGTEGSSAAVLALRPPRTEGHRALHEEGMLRHYHVGLLHAAPAQGAARQSNLGTTSIRAARLSRAVAAGGGHATPPLQAKAALNFPFQERAATHRPFGGALPMSGERNRAPPGPDSRDDSPEVKAGRAASNHWTSPAHLGLTDDDTRTPTCQPAARSNLAGGRKTAVEPVGPRAITRRTMWR